MKKRIVALLFAMLVSVSSVFMLVSCGGNKNTDGTDNKNTDGTDNENTDGTDSDVNESHPGNGSIGEEIK